MEALTVHTGKAALLDRVNVDTDQIIPKQFLKRIERSGFGQFLFFDWRFDENGNEDPSFELNDPKFEGSSILVTRDNFGCGSSREHAPWALLDYGFKVLIAPSFADIFHNNCFKNGILPIVLPNEAVDQLAEKVGQGNYELTVDLEKQEIRDGSGLVIPFSVDAYRRELMLAGLDDIGVTLQLDKGIASYEESGKAMYQEVFKG